MHVRLPKPLHGWRAFVGEVGIIVLGVLIALGAGQLVESWHVRAEANSLRATMHDELAIDRARWQVTHAEFPCALAWLDQMDRWSMSAPANERLPTVPGPIVWNMHLSSWEVARSSPALQDMDLKERDAIAAVYQALDAMQRTIALTQDDWRHLRALASTADQPENRRALRLADAEARYAMLQLDHNFVIIDRQFEKLGIRADFAGARGLSSQCPAARNLVRAG